MWSRHLMIDRRQLLMTHCIAILGIQSYLIEWKEEIFKKFLSNLAWYWPKISVYKKISHSSLANNINCSYHLLWFWNASRIWWVIVDFTFYKNNHLWSRVWPHHQNMPPTFFMEKRCQLNLQLKQNKLVLLKYSTYSGQNLPI